MRNAFAKKILELATTDPSIILITGDLGYGVLDEYREALPSQFINAGITEQSMMSMAAGMASKGYRPFVYSIANFPSFRCLEQIRLDVCYMNNPVTIVSVGAGLGYGVHGYTHHAIEDVSIMRALPNLRIFSPSDGFETNFSMERILSDSAPCYLRLGKGGETDIHSSYDILINGPQIIKEGNDGIIAWVGGIGSNVIAASKMLERMGIFPALISLPEVSESNLKSLLDYSSNQIIVTVEEHILVGGFGSWLLEIASRYDFQNRIKNIGLTSDVINIVGTQKYLLECSGLDPISLSNTLKDYLAP